MANGIRILTIDQIINEGYNSSDASVDSIESFEKISGILPKKLQYVYLLREREFIRLGEDTYKIGKTTQLPERRLRGYPKGSEVYLFEETKDCTIAEKLIIGRFNECFKCKTEYGNEYYSGNVELMKIMIKNVCLELSYSVMVGCISFSETSLIRLDDLDSDRDSDSDIDSDDIGKFIQIIKSTKPIWYTKDEWILSRTLYDMFILETKSPMVISVFCRSVNDRIIFETAKKTINKKQQRLVRLKPINEL